jgi:histone-lysine N-methyltransferase SETMAR
MATKLEEYTTEDQRSVVRFLWAKRLSAKGIHKEMFVKKCLSRKAVHNWLEKYSQGRSKVADYARPGRLVDNATEATVQPVEELIRTDRRITIDSVATALGCSHGLAYTIMHDRFKCRKVRARWVPRELKDREKINRVGLSLQDLLQYAEEREGMLNRIVTGQESWVHQYQPESKHASMKREHPTSPSTKKFKVTSTPSVVKVKLTVFCDSQGAILAHLQKRGENVNFASYYEVVLKLRDAIHRKRLSQLARGVLLHHDNARPHTARATQERIQELQREFLEHPSYSPDLTPSDFHLFGPLKSDLMSNVSLMTKRMKRRCGSA